MNTQRKDQRAQNSYLWAGQHVMYVRTYINQFGCRPGRSTTHALIAIQHTWMETLDNKGSVRALFVDFKKAFDIVNHNILFNKLKKI